MRTGCVQTVWLSLVRWRGAVQVCSPPLGPASAAFRKSCPNSELSFVPVSILGIPIRQTNRLLMNCDGWGSLAEWVHCSTRQGDGNYSRRGTSRHDWREERERSEQSDEPGTDRRLIVRTLTPVVPGQSRYGPAASMKTDSASNPAVGPYRGVQGGRSNSAHEQIHQNAQPAREVPPAGGVRGGRSSP